jgi:hypothetical protein
MEAASQPSLRVIATELGERPLYLYQVCPKLCQAVRKRTVKALPALSGQRSSLRSRTSGSASNTPKPRPKSVPQTEGITQLLHPPAAKGAQTMSDDLQTQKDELAQKLREILAANETPAPSLHRIVQRLGINISTLKRRCPELCAEIVRRAKTYRQTVKNQQQALLEQIVAENLIPPPSLLEVAQRLGWHGLTSLQRQYPEASQLIVSRYVAYQEQRWQLAHTALEAALKTEGEMPPLGMTEVLLF